MTVGPDTFIARMLAEAGMAARSPASDRRYPELDLDAMLDLAPRAVLLSSEPYRFREPHAQALLEALRARAAERGIEAPQACATIDGEMTSWYGSRAIAGLRYLADFREALGERVARRRTREVAL